MIIFVIIAILAYAFYRFYSFERQETSQHHNSKDHNRSFIIGSQFENFVRFNYYGSNYETTHVTPSHEENCIEFNDESYKPDLKLRDSNTGKEFWIECKYRSYKHNTKEYKIITENQLQRHRRIKDSPVFVILGIGGKPNKPLYLYKIPIAKCKSVMTIGHLFNQFQINK
ncbi:hypothetical protein LCGC14_1044700 [marine sediment metagenome]|uniref:Restriction endonuclease n=2 Tax=root TaxID=1 RepID=A0A831QVM3_9FLAO|nr:hypothetical protein [Pricia antarctica]